MQALCIVVSFTFNFHKCEMLIMPIGHLIICVPTIVFMFRKHSSIFSSKKTGAKDIFNQTLNISLVNNHSRNPRSTEERAGLSGNQLLKLSSATVEIQDSIK